MPAPNLFEELKEALTKFKTFLDQNVNTIKPAVQALKAIFPQITDLINQLIELMGKLKTEIDKLNVGSLGEHLGKVTEFSTGVKNLLEAAKGLLPNEADTINTVLEAANVVSSLPSLDQIKNEIKALIDSIIANLNQLKS
ncbi:MAG: hypothetical protein ACREAM_30290 [Blastocatellia bacterium]